MHELYLWSNTDIHPALADKYTVSKSDYLWTDELREDGAAGDTSQGPIA